jgi:flagellar biogenesis protein FliO
MFPAAAGAVMLIIAFGVWVIDRWQQRRRRTGSK